jgi:hypothetical protein
VAQKDWTEVLELFEKKAPGYIEKFAGSDDLFLPDENRPNPFGSGSGNFSAAELYQPQLTRKLRLVLASRNRGAGFRSTRERNFPRACTSSG